MYACEKLRREDRTRLFEKLKMNNAQALDEEVMSLVSVVPVVQSKALAMLQLLDASYRLVTPLFLPACWSGTSPTLSRHPSLAAFACSHFSQTAKVSEKNIAN